MSDLIAWQSERWILRHHASPAPLLGWFMLDTRRHVASAADFDLAEEGEFAAVLAAAMRAIRTVVHAPRVYVIMFGEGAHHLHAHLIPRDPNCAGTSAWEIADWYRAVASGSCAPAAMDQVASVVVRVGQEMRAAITI